MHEDSGLHASPIGRHLRPMDPLAKRRATQCCLPRVLALRVPVSVANRGHDGSVTLSS